MIEIEIDKSDPNNIHFIFTEEECKNINEMSSLLARFKYDFYQFMKPKIGKPIDKKEIKNSILQFIKNHELYKQKLDNESFTDSIFAELIQNDIVQIINNDLI